MVGKKDMVGKLWCNLDLGRQPWLRGTKHIVFVIKRATSKKTMKTMKILHRDISRP